MKKEEIRAFFVTLFRVVGFRAIHQTLKEFEKPAWTLEAAKGLSDELDAEELSELAQLVIQEEDRGLARKFLKRCGLRLKQGTKKSKEKYHRLCEMAGKSYSDKTLQALLF